MLVLSRQVGSSVCLEIAGATIEVIITDIAAGRVKLAFRAPDECNIYRSELQGRMEPGCDSPDSVNAAPSPILKRGAAD